jgi:hypothetical protein
MFCAICLATTGKRTPADPRWPYVPSCHACVIECGGVIDAVVVDFSAARARMNPRVRSAVPGDHG